MSFRSDLLFMGLLFLIQMIPSLVMAWIGVIVAWGLTRPKKTYAPQCDAYKNRFAIVVCAHDEENSIASLLKSIGNVDYPKDRFHVYVLADHCTDRTHEIAASFPFVTVMDRVTGPTDGKGDVLSWGIDRILKSPAAKNIDAFAFFDADNVLKEDFLTQINRSLNSGNEIVQGNRLGGQPYRSFVTKWYTLYWAAYSIYFSYSREKAGVSAFLTGTGFAVKKELLAREGWHTSTITEDVEYSIQNCIKGRRVAFCLDAVCYDEQPYQLRVMFSQLARWCTGSYQILGRYFKATWQSRKESKIQKTDSIMMLLMGPASWVSWVISLINWVIMFFRLPLFYSVVPILMNVLGTIFVYIGVYATAKFNKIPFRKIGFSLFTFPLFLYFYRLCSLKACFFPSRKWKRIEHQALQEEQGA